MIAIGPAGEKGRGVFARSPIARGTLIEEAPVVVLPASQIGHLRRTILDEYCFKWGSDWDEAAILLGTCSICNHSFDPNAVFVCHFEELTIAFFALCDIAAGEEITINYNGDPASKEPVCFCFPS